MTICGVLKMSKRRGNYITSYRKAIIEKIELMDGQVFTRADLTSDHSNREQLRLNRALRVLIENGVILKISHGLFAKATRVRFPGGDEKTVLRESFEEVAAQALDRLGLDWEYGEAIKAYNEGKSTQIPAIFSVKLHSRYRGRIAAEGRRVIFEGGKNAR